MIECVVCHGKYGVPGNENIVNGVAFCDYCHAAMSYVPEPAREYPTEGAKIVDLHQHVHGRNHRPSSCPSCKGLVAAIDAALAAQATKHAEIIAAATRYAKTWHAVQGARFCNQATCNRCWKCANAEGAHADYDDARANLVALLTAPATEGKP
jgi:hypothetical protein